MIVIGLVGRIGAGKSTVAARFAGHGATVVDADRRAHEVLAEPPVVAEIARRFGPGVLDPGGRIDRAAVARLVFGDTPAHEAALATLEEIVHPRVRTRVEGQLDDLRTGRGPAGRPEAVVLDVPLLVQAGWADLCTHLVVVDCDDAVRRARLAARGWAVGEIAARDRAWARRYRAPEADPRTWHVDASGDPAYTALQVDRVWQAIRGR